MNDSLVQILPLSDVENPHAATPTAIPMSNSMLPKYQADESRVAGAFISTPLTKWRSRRREVRDPPGSAANAPEDSTCVCRACSAHHLHQLSTPNPGGSYK